MIFQLLPVAPFFDTSRPFFFSYRKNIFNIIFKKPNLLRPLRPCAIFVFRNKKPDAMIRLGKPVYNLKRRFIFIEKVPHFCFHQRITCLFSIFVPNIMISLVNFNSSIFDLNKPQF